MNNSSKTESDPNKVWYLIWTIIAVAAMIGFFVWACVAGDGTLATRGGGLAVAASFAMLISRRDDLQRWLKPMSSHMPQSQTSKLDDLLLGLESFGRQSTQQRKFIIAVSVVSTLCWTFGDLPVPMIHNLFAKKIEAAPCAPVCAPRKSAALPLRLSQDPGYLQRSAGAST